MRTFKKALGFFCIAECIAGFYFLFTMPSDTKFAVIATIIFFALMAFLLLKKTKNEETDVNITKTTSPLNNINLNNNTSNTQFAPVQTFPQEYQAPKENCNTQPEQPEIQPEPIPQQIENNTPQYLDNEDVMKKIQLDYQKMIATRDSYKSGQRNIFSDNKFSAEEQIFFDNVYEEFQKAGLKPNLIHLTRLSSGMFNVDYIEEGYVGKVEISQTKEKFRVIKQGAKRALKVFDNLSDAEQFINGRTSYTIEHEKSKHIYFMQYFIGQKIHSDYFNSLQELIDTIPRWIKYVKYMKRHYR